MKRNVGVWIDHRRAVIVRITGDAEEIQSIDSDMEKHIRFAGGRPEDQQDHKFANHLNAYYERVIPFLQDADAILILGPGEAKGEFQKHLRAGPLSSRIVGIETLDKMAFDRIASKVREFFLGSHEDARQPHGDKKAIHTHSGQSSKGESQ